MQEQANRNTNNGQQKANTTPPAKNQNEKEILGEYIDFEEVK